MLIDFIHIVNEDLVLTGVEILLQLLILIQQLLLILLFMELIQHVLNVQNFTTLVEIDLVHAIVEIILHIFDIGQVLHNAESAFKSAEEAASMT